ncbi:MAG: Tol biopolymer transport system component [Flavobacteriales bacterium]|jgi:Tol biopolymer transport system component
MNYFIRSAALASFCILLLGCGGSSGNNNDQFTPNNVNVPVSGTPTQVTLGSKPENLVWVSAASSQIVESNSSNANVLTLTDSEFDDYKPVYSPDGSMIAFFRVFDYQDFNVNSWLTKICVINSDGTGFRELTTAADTNWNPMWTRDGTNQIIFTRLENLSPFLSSVYRVDPNADIGDASRISSPSFGEFSYSGLQDGRIFVRRWSFTAGFSYHLLSPSENNPTYQAFNLDSSTYIHKVSISPSEDKIAYMKVIGNSAGNTFQNAVIAYADIDTNTMMITNEKIITPFDSNTAYWYPAWTADESHILYAYTENFSDINAIGDIRAFNLQTEETSIISSQPGLDYRYPNVKGVVK